MRKLDNTSCEGLRLQVKTVSHQNLKNYTQNARFFSVAYEAKDMKFCTQVPRVCVHKRLVLHFIYLLESGFRDVNFRQYTKFNQSM